MTGRDDEIRALVAELRALMDRARPIVEELTAYARDGAGTEEAPADES